MSDRDLGSNPFFVLAIEPSCTRMEMERQGQLLLSMLEVGFADAKTYSTPVGERERTPEAVREAMAALRDPDRRLGAELWARAPVLTDASQPASSSEAAGTNGWRGAMRALGWKR